IDEITDELFRRLERSGIKGKSLTLKIKYKAFTLFTRSKTESQYLENKFSLSALAKQLCQSRPFDKPIRLLGLSLSNLNTEEKKQVAVQLKVPFPEFL
ncbi:DinB/UmuC family translesion DNA polymerase, partial [Elizabethkingia meningoseptica]|uniref:DinB/UmuC family translesion DNA polymerase n=1 Tax=Elizabethkingia meningoseptica TaxID=238 RepID=UPI003F6900A7